MGSLLWNWIVFVLIDLGSKVSVLIDGIPFCIREFGLLFRVIALVLFLTLESFHSVATLIRSALLVLLARLLRGCPGELPLISLQTANFPGRCLA